MKNFLQSAPLSKWSLTHDVGGRRFSMMTTNISEVYNNVLKGARSVPMTAIMELTFYRTNEYFRQMRGVANALNAQGEVWVEEIKEHIQRKRNKSNQHHIRDFDDVQGIYQIITPTRWVGETRKKVELTLSI